MGQIKIVSRAAQEEAAGRRLHTPALETNWDFMKKGEKLDSMREY